MRRAETGERGIESVLQDLRAFEEYEAATIGAEPLFTEASIPDRDAHYISATYVHFLLFNLQALVRFHQSKIAVMQIKGIQENPNQRKTEPKAEQPKKDTRKREPVNRKPRC